MKKFLLVALTMILAVGTFGFQASPAYALGATARVLNATLSGPAIAGVVPAGKADFQAFEGANSLVIAVSNVNEPDGTCLTTALNGTDLGFPMIVRGGSAGLSLDPSLGLSSPAVHSGEVITISVGGGDCGVIILGSPSSTAGSILSGTFQAQ